MSKFSFTEQAEFDLEKIVDFTLNNWGRLQATKYIDNLYDVANLLSINPSVGLNRDALAEGLFSFPFESHIFFYFKGTDEIIFIRVLHKSMDPIKHFQK